MNDTVLVIYDYRSLHFCLCQQKLILVSSFSEIVEALTIDSHLLLLEWIEWSDDSFVSILEEPLVRINLVEYQVDVALETVRVHIEGTEWLEELKHFLNAFAND